MPPALDRLLASPSALRVLRAIISTPNLPSGYYTPTNWCQRRASKPRYYSSNAITITVGPGNEKREVIEDAEPQTVHIRRVQSLDWTGGSGATATVEAAKEDKEAPEDDKPKRIRIRRFQTAKPGKGRKVTSANTMKDEAFGNVGSRENNIRQQVTSVSPFWTQMNQESNVSQPFPIPNRDGDLEVESIVALSSKPKHVHLKVDDPKYRFDFAYWVQLLQFQERTRGPEGIRHIWTGMRERQLDLPTTGHVADALWGTFVKDIKIVEEVLQHASDLKKRTGRIYENLYLTCVGHWLPRRPTTAYNAHSFMVENLASMKRPLRELARFVRVGKSRLQPSLNKFRAIYWESNDRDVYDTLIPMLFQTNKALAQEWHSFFVQHNDLPSHSLAGSPMVAELSAYHVVSLQPSPRGTKSGSQVLVMRPEAIEMRSARSHTPKFNREIMSRLLGESHNVKPKKEFDDAFCARLFATKAFSPTSVIKGLGMFGIELIGPLALREMGLRTAPLDEMPRRFKELKDAGVSIGKSVFSKAVEKFTFENRLDLVKELLESDQHPDVLEDTKLQEELLTFYVSKDDWRQVHRTLAILTMFHARPEVESWNLLLRTQSKHFSGVQVNRVLEDMHANGIEVTHLTLNSLHADILRHRSPSKRPVYRYADRFDDLRFLTKIWLRIMYHGGDIPPWRWREILRRFGMTGRLKELRRLVLWLADWYSPGKATEIISTFPVPAKAINTTRTEFPNYRNYQFQNMPPSHPAHPFQEIFPPSFQIALIEWGFKSGLAPNSKLERSLYLRKAQNPHVQKTRIHWMDGLHLLLALRAAGVYVRDDVVKKAVKKRMVILYGPGISNRRENRIARKVNPYPFQEMIKQSEEVWGKRLFHWPGRKEQTIEARKRENRSDGLPARKKHILQRQRIGMAELRWYLGR